MITKGILYIISAPSGAGKSTLINELLTNQQTYDARISISYTTRKIRPGEIHGIHYFFVSLKEFKLMINKNYFAEYAIVHDNYYGTSNQSIKLLLSTNKDVFLDIDWQGAQQIRRTWPQARSIFILPPSSNELYLRLRGRGKDSEEVVAKRMANAIIEIKHYKKYNYLIINDDLNTALLDFKSIIRSERLRLEYQQIYQNKLINKLIKK